MNCNHCQDELTLPEGTTDWVDYEFRARGEVYCSSCFERYVRECGYCGLVVHEDDILEVRGSSRMYEYCNDCIEETNCFTCDDCGVLFTDDFYSGDGLCDNCYHHEDEIAVPRRSVIDDPKLRTPGTLGEYIQSPRDFGIELETVFTKTDSMKILGEKISRSWKFCEDGSLRGSKNTLGEIEIVSGIMSGKAGEDEIKKLCDEAQKSGFKVNKSCGYHLHLNAPEYKRNPEDEFSEGIDERWYCMITRKRDGEVVDKVGVPGEGDIPPWISDNDLRQVELTWKKEKVSELSNNKGQAFIKLRNLWYVYLVFDDVFRAMQPNSRRGNGMCKASNSQYSLENIRDLRDFNELEALWYKIDRRRKKETQYRETLDCKRHKHGSRYTGFNLEPLLRNNSSTIEFRYHSPTLNPKKILMWINIHQTILDKISRVSEINMQALDKALGETNLIRKVNTMCNLFDIKDKTKGYIIERIKKFNKVTDTEDEEVEDSEVGRPYYRVDGSEMAQVANVPQFDITPPAFPSYDEFIRMRGNNNNN